MVDEANHPRSGRQLRRPARAQRTAAPGGAPVPGVRALAARVPGRWGRGKVTEVLAGEAARVTDARPPDRLPAVRQPAEEDGGISLPYRRGADLGGPGAGQTDAKLAVHGAAGRIQRTAPAADGCGRRRHPDTFVRAQSGAVPGDRRAVLQFRSTADRRGRLYDISRGGQAYRAT